MGRFQIGEIDQIPLAPYGPLHFHEIGEGTNWCLHPVNLLSICALVQLFERDASHVLGDQVDFTKFGLQMEAAPCFHPILRKRGTIGPSRLPSRNELPDTDEIAGIRIEDGVNVSRRPDHAVPNQGNAADEDVADLGVIQVFEDATEAGHRQAAARSIA